MQVTSQTIRTAIIGLIVLGLSYFTYFKNYQNPSYLFWDENYHIATAQKYLHGVFFMEPHPPLGKLFLAAGEYLLKPNEASNQFLDTMYIQNETLPQDFSFAGYRFFPALLAWLTAPLVFFVFFLLTKKEVLSGLLSSFYIFDNAIIVHARGAMLESPQLFFITASLVVFFLLIQGQGRGRLLLWSVLFGFLVGCAIAIKVNAAILLLLFPALGVFCAPQLRKVIASMALSGAVCVLTFLGMCCLHFVMARTIHPSLENAGYFNASSEYREILDGKRAMSFMDLPSMFHDAYIFAHNYERTVPTLDLCKDGENGSPFFYWPIGARSINYRWESSGEGFRYLYLQANPVIWFFGLLGVVLSAALILANTFFALPGSARPRNELYLFLVLYICYMLAMSRIERVMYLYHYFVPLLFSFILFGLVLEHVSRVGRFSVTAEGRLSCMSFVALLSCLSFRFYAPLTYYQTLTNDQFQKRALLRIWNLFCVHCPASDLYHRACSTQTSQIPEVGHMLIGTLPAEEGRQDWGQPKFGESVDGQAATVQGTAYERVLGVHARSMLRYRLGKKYAQFKAKVALPDYTKNTRASIIFEVHVDNNLAWKSEKVLPGQAAQVIDIPVADKDVLELRVEDAGDGIDNDHALWIEPELVTKD